jgi:hypothetical protein
VRKVDGLSLIFIEFYVIALTPRLNSTETSLQLSGFCSSIVLIGTCLRSRYSVTAVVYWLLSRSLPSNGSICHNMLVCVSARECVFVRICVSVRECVSASARREREPLGSEIAYNSKSDILRGCSSARACIHFIAVN